MNPYSLDRRQFLTHATAASMMLAMHDRAAWGSPESDYSTKLDESAGPRILGLRLLTATPLTTLREFYQETLGLSTAQDSPNELTVTAGATRLTFVKTEASAAPPFYHVAFNIPQNKILAACEWQRQRTELNYTPLRMRDDKYPDEVRHFRNWDAHSVFFWDPAGNLLEYIARHSLKNDADGEFTSRDILYASEIAFITHDVSTTATHLKETFGLEQYSTGSESFQAIGDELGLLLVMIKGRIWGHKTSQEKATDIFPTVVDIRGTAGAGLGVPDYPYEITAL